MARLEDTEKRHNTHMVRTIRVCLYRMCTVRKIVLYAYGICTIRVWYIPYAYGTKYAYGIEQRDQLEEITLESSATKKLSCRELQLQTNHL